MTAEQEAAEPRIVCDMTALSAGERERHAVLLDRLGESVSEMKELPDGYGLRLSPDDWQLASDYVELERRCCPFIAFSIRREAHAEAIWLELTGPSEVKAFLTRTIAALRSADT